jgi:xylulokinase
MYLGLDLSTQSLTGVVIDTRERRVAWQHSIEFDRVLPHYGTRHGVLPGDDPLVATSPPLMWAEALDLFLAALARDSGLDLSRLQGISGAGQQHGSVYLNATATPTLGSVDSRKPLVDQLGGIFARSDAPIWMDSSTTRECEAITHAVGGDDAVQRLTGSRATERFTGPQIKRLAESRPADYARTERIHLVSSFMASLLVGRNAPLEPGDAAGMNLMDIRALEWAALALDATAPGLRAKLPPIVASATVVGSLSRYWTERYGLPPVPVVVWTGDNPSSAVGVGLTDALFGVMNEPRLDPSGASNVFGAATGGWLALVCFKNGALARERVRDQYGLDWDGFSARLRESPPGNGGAIMLPWFEPEITPRVFVAGARRSGFDASDAGRNIRAVIEGQMLAMKRHSAWMGDAPATIVATGGAAANREVLQVMADVFGAEVHQRDVGASAALGAALRAWHGAALAAGTPVEWRDVVKGFARPSQVITPDQRNTTMYREMMASYAAFEAHELGQGPGV